MTAMTTPKQPADRKKPKPRPRTKPTGTGPDPKPAPVPATKMATIKGREIEVSKPEPDQILAWDRVLQKLEQMAREAETANQIRRLVDKVEIIINSVIVNEDDREWLEDGQLGGTLTLNDAAEIVTQAIALYEDEIKGAPANRAARRSKE